jgi:hypothetical protein
MNGEFKVTPWEVTGDIDYDLLVEKFGTKRIDQGAAGPDGEIWRASTPAEAWGRLLAS